MVYTYCILVNFQEFFRLHYFFTCIVIPYSDSWVHARCRGSVEAGKGNTEHPDLCDLSSPLLPSSAQSPLRQFYKQMLEAPLRLLVLPIRTELHLGLSASAGATRNPGGLQRELTGPGKPCLSSALIVTALGKRKLRSCCKSQLQHHKTGMVYRAFFWWYAWD